MKYIEFYASRSYRPPTTKESAVPRNLNVGNNNLLPFGESCFDLFAKVAVGEYKTKHKHKTTAHTPLPFMYPSTTSTIVYAFGSYVDRSMPGTCSALFIVRAHFGLANIHTSFSTQAGSKIHLPTLITLKLLSLTIAFNLSRQAAHSASRLATHRTQQGSGPRQWIRATYYALKQGSRGRCTDCVN